MSTGSIAGKAGAGGKPALQAGRPACADVTTGGRGVPCPGLWCHVAPALAQASPKARIGPKDAMDGSPPLSPAATLVVCTTCRRADGTGGTDRPGARMLAALAAGDLPPGVTLRPVECLSVCTNGCAVALHAPGKWSYVYGNLDPDTHAAAILDGAARYAATPDGLVPWRDRPEVFRKQSVARIPPLEPLE